MKATPLFALMLALPLLTSAQPQSWAWEMIGPWRPSGVATFNTREGDQDDHMRVMLKWHRLVPDDREDEVFNKFNSYEFNLGLYDDANKVYNKCKTEGFMPDFYDDCKTAGVSEVSGKVFGFGTYSTKKIVREKPYYFTISMKNTHLACTT